VLQGGVRRQVPYWGSRGASGKWQLSADEHITPDTKALGTSTVVTEHSAQSTGYGHGALRIDID
jgi:hypothetical protein